MTVPYSTGRQALAVTADDCCSSPGEPYAGCRPEAEPGGARWQRDARAARWLSWASLAWMCTEGGVGLWQGTSAGSIALTGWALGSVVEGLASVIVIWRFTGRRLLSERSERQAQQAVAATFWLLAPCIAAESAWDLATGHHAEATTIGITLTALAVVVMPVLGWAKHRLAARLGSAATAGEGTQNYLCAVQAAAVLLGLAITAAWPAAWWADPVIGLAIAATAVRAGIESWRGGDCC